MVFFCINMKKKASHTSLLKRLSQLKVGRFGNDFLQTWDKTKTQLEATLIVADILRLMREKNISPRVFQSGVSMSWFRDNSTRTRYSFRSASDLLGLDIQDLDEDKSQIAHGETIHETANMLSFLTEIIGIRDDIFLGEGHKFQVEVAEAVQDGFDKDILPQRPSVINLQSDRDHPTQSLSDLLHLSHEMGGIGKLKGKKMVMSWAYSPSYGKPMSVAQGVVNVMTRFGMDVVLAYPKGYHLIGELEEQSKKFAEESKGSFSITHNMKEAFAGADIVYPKSWASFAVMEKRTALLKKRNSAGLKKLEVQALRQNARYKSWECTEKMMKLTKNGKALYMHCLPADVTGVSCKKGEVAESVFDRYRTETYKQAGYKPYIVAAMMFLTRFENPVKVLRKAMRQTNKRILV